MKYRFPLSSPRRDDGTLLPALLVGALVLMAALQLMLTADVDLPPAEIPHVGRTAPLPDVAPVAAPAAILEHPLFSPTRSGAAGAGGTADAQPLGGAAVAGMIAVGGVVRGLLQLPNHKSLMIAPGQSFAGWRLDSLRDGEAHFSRGADHLTLPFGQAAPVADASKTSEETQ